MATNFQIQKFKGNNFSFLVEIEDKGNPEKGQLLTINLGKPTRIANGKWKHMDDNAIANLHLA